MKVQLAALPFGHCLLCLIFGMQLHAASVSAQENGRPKYSHRECEHYAKQEADRQISVAGGAAKGAMSGAAMGGILGGSKGAQQGAMMGLVAGGFKRNQDRKKFHNAALEDCLEGRIDI